MDQIPEISTTKEAGHVYLLMQDEYRISRNARASWYFNHLNKRIVPDPEDSEDKELKVLSVVPKIVDNSTDEDEDEGDRSSQVTSYHITPTTIVSFLAKKYRFVFVLDLSPSTASVDLHSDEVLLDELYRCLCSVIKSLLNPFQVPGCKTVLEPEVYVTVVGHTPLINTRSNQVLVQGCRLSRLNLDRVLSRVAEKLQEFENEIAKCMADVLGSGPDDAAEGSQKMMLGSLEELEDARDLPDQVFHLMTPEAGFINMLRYGMLALHLLNENSASGIIILTDGIVGLPDAALFESLMIQLRHNSIAVSFLQIGHWLESQAGFGQVPYNELMQFIATATFGSYFTKIREKVASDTYEMNVYQVALLTWSFQRALAGLKVDGSMIDTYEELNENLAWTHRIPSFGENRHLWATPLMKKKHTERNVQTALPHLISCRLREGYTIKQVTISKAGGESQIEVQLVLPWRDKVWIHYKAVSAWPLNAGKRLTHIEVTIEGSYAFLHDVTCPQKKPFKSPYRAAVVKKYWQTLQGMLESDKLLVHLQSFSSNPNFYKVPDSVKKGVPLFYFPPHSTSPQLNMQLSSKDPLVAQFSNFWKPMLMLDVNIWQKWMHTHRIGLILEHDKPLGKHLHTPNSSGRFHPVACRQAQIKLNVFLAEASTFVLMENHAYITLIFDDPESSPTSFYVLRLVHKPPCLVLRLAFLGGTSGQQRYKIVADLTEGISMLMFPHRGTAKTDKAKKESTSSDPPSSSSSTSRLERPWSETPCCHIMAKPTEKILMRYERVPYDFLALDFPHQLEQMGQALPVSAVTRAASSVFTTLSRYLYHRRWVWAVQTGASQPMTMQAIGRILSNLTKIRLQEGFLFANASCGIINMIAEVNMVQEDDEESAEADRSVEGKTGGRGPQTHPCVIQYLVFPPHTTTLADSLDDPEELEAPESDREQQIITEVWVEPQYGRVVGSPPERAHFDGMDYTQLAEATLPDDLECISTMMTFEYLNLMCQSSTVPSPTCSSSLPVHPSPALLDQQPGVREGTDSAVQRMPFAFDLMKVLSKCQQAELLFSMFTQGGSGSNPADPGVPAAPAPVPEQQPNALLLAQFLRRMEEAHDRELHLQDEECRLLRDQVVQRPREHLTNPLPLRPEAVAANPAADTEAPGTSSSEDKAASSSGVGRWRCFIKSVNMTHIILCFVPTSLDDLRSLVCTPETVPGLVGENLEAEPAGDEQGQGENRQDEDVVLSESEDTVHLPESETGVGYNPEETGESPDRHEQVDGRAESEQLAEDKEDPHVTPDPSELAQGACSIRQEPAGDSAPSDTLDNVPVVGPNDEAHPRPPTSLVIPVYVYNCPLSGLTDQLVSHSLPQVDLYQDFTKKVDMCVGEGRHSLTEDGGPGGHRHRVDSETIRDKIRQSAEERPEAGPGGGTEFRHHLSLINEHYHRSFVIGVYDSLLAGHDMHCEDVDTVINGICEESLPIEMNITRYLHNTCGHIRQLLERAKIEQMMREDTAKMVPDTVDVKEEDSPDPMDVTDSDTMDADHKQKSPLVLPGSPRRAVDMFSDHTPVLLPLALLTSDSPCEASPSLHSLIQRKFSQIVSQYFRPVPSNPEFFYFYPSETKSKSSTSNLDTTGGPFNTSATSDSREPEAEAYREDVFASDVEYDAADDEEAEGSECEGELGRLRGSLSEDDDDDESALSDLRRPPPSADGVPPLFIHLICSVRTRGRVLRSMAVRNLPTCLGDLRSCLNDVTGTIDLSDLQVTIDVICLTLPSEQDFSEYMERPSFNRTMSYTSQASYNAPYDREDTVSFNGRLTKEVDDSLSCLPTEQLNAVNSCKEEVLWLLRDEIASSLRQTVPVTAETLEMVANHVSSSKNKNKPCCITENVELQFVYGPEQSLTHFIQAFERIDLPGYLLNKETNYYYLLLDQARVHNLAHAKAVSSALHDLYTDSKTFRPDAKVGTVQRATHHRPDGLQQQASSGSSGAPPSSCVPPGEGSTETDTGIGAVVDGEGVDLGGGAAKGPMEGSDRGEGIVADWDRRVRKEGSRADRRHSSGESLGKVVEVSNEEGLPDGQSPHAGTVGIEETGPVKDSSLKDDLPEGTISSEKDKGSGRPGPGPPGMEDIKISVIRPSPVKEARAGGAGGDEVKDIDELLVKEKEADEACDLSADVETTTAATNNPKVAVHSEGPRTLHFVGVDSQPSSPPDGTPQQPPQQSELTLSSSERLLSKRTSSGVSLDKLRGYGLTANSGPQTPSRSRHQSGPQTPLSGSLFDATSQGSIEEEGYDAGSSDSDEEGIMMSFNESMLRYRQLPDFWLIMEIKQDGVDVFFHTRDTGEKHASWVDQQQLFQHVINIIKKMCCTVNQWLLLQDLAKTRQCNQLLVPEADEDVQWPGDDKTSSVSAKHKPPVPAESDDSDSETSHGRYLAAALQFMPGHFACECVWKKEFVLHPRLKGDPRKVGTSRGVYVLKRVLETFAVGNRKNMFVIKENLSGAVFYLRLEQNLSARRQNSGQSAGDSSPGVRAEDELAPLSVSRSSSMMSLPQKGKLLDVEEDTKLIQKPSATDLLHQRSLLDSATTEDDPMQTSQTTQSLRAAECSEESIVLSAYGIGNVGPDISQQLVNLLQNRLDNDMLQQLVGLFARNPMFKLMPEDVKFIQPEYSAPKQVLQLTIPPSALLQQHALSYYLYQNLLQFLHTPKYSDSGPSGVFCDYSQPDAPAIPENQMFLCSTRPQHAGGKGMACIHQNFVDGTGSPIQLMGSPKPSPNAYKDKLDPAMFESLVATQVYTASPTHKGPGPTTLVQFAVWERGEMDSQLGERLIRGMKYAVCDIVMEYRLLTAPLCDVPAHYSTGMDSPMHSAPQSPVTHFISSEQRSYSGSPADGVKKPTEGGRTPKEKTMFNLQSLFKSKSASKESPKTWHSPDGQRQRELELRQKIQKYEMGERGSLQPVFSTTLVDWFEFCTKLGVPSVQSLQLDLTSRFPLEYVLRETQTIIGSLTTDVTCRVFRLTESSSSSHREGLSAVYLPYSVSRSHQSQEKSDSCLDLPACSQPNVPGKTVDYMIVGRNVQQWRASIDYLEGEEGIPADLTHPKIQKTTQRFLPQEGCSPGPETAPAGQQAGTQAGLHTDKSFVPRQRLMLATIKDKKMKVYTYNWAQNMQGSFETQMTKMVGWHNARSLLLTSILSQKAGLFNLPTTYEQNLSMVWADLSPLVKYTSPPPTATSGRPRVSSMGQRPLTSHPGSALLQSTFRDQKPACPMHRSTYASLRDPLHRHGAQMLELKRSTKKEEEKNATLMHLYENWQQRMGPSHAPIQESDLELLKASSRMIHSVATPLLLSPHWRQKVLPKSASSRHDSRASDTNKPRSRHSSGASVRSKRSDSMDSKKRVDSPDITAAKPHMEELWHIDLRSSFVSQYIQYLQSLGFVQIRTRSTSPKRGRHLSGDVQQTKPDMAGLVIKPNYTYLQKTLPGGIMLLEVGFKEVCFCIYVYAFECSRLPIRSINPQLAVIFTDECEKFKDLTHAHSFAHDFHLRTIQSYITGRHPAFKQNYHLSGFLQDFIQYYPYAPSFSRNYVLQGVCNLPLSTNNASTQLFRYMLEHDKLYGMRAIRMVPLADDDQDPENEYALVKQFCGIPEDDATMLKAKPKDYDVGLVITHDTVGPAETDRPVLRLKYYILLTSRKELFPKQTLEKRLGMLKSNAARQFPAGISHVEAPVAEERAVEVAETAEGKEGSAVVVPPVVQYIGVRQETTNYLGYTNKHQAPVYGMLLRQSEYAREKIQEIVGSAMSQCRRDLLWQRMLLPGNVTEEEGRRKRRSEHDEGKEPYLTRLSFSEFQELLGIVTRVQLSAIDRRLTTLENMNLAWYHSLVRVLRQQYGVSHRYFSSADGLVQYVVVLNANFLDTFMMLGVDSLSNKTELCAVYRERIPDQSHTPTNPNLPAFAVQTLMEGFVNTCFYHMWTGLL